MKKFFVLIVIFSFLCGCSFATDDLMYTNDMWDHYGEDITKGMEAKPVSDEEFEKAIQQVDSKVNKWKNWAEKRKQPKGENFSQSNETEVLNQEHGEDKSLPILSLPSEIEVQGDCIPIGHYQVLGEKLDNGETVLNLYQANYLIARINAIETQDDFNKDEILFADWVVENEENNIIKIIYGSLDFNAFALVKIKDYSQ